MKKFIFILILGLTASFTAQAGVLDWAKGLFNNQESFGDTIGTLPQWKASTTPSVIIPRSASTYVGLNQIASTTPTGNLQNGLMFYDTSTGKFRCYQNGAWTDCIGGGGTPGGSNYQLQYNNAGSFGGIATGTAGTFLAASSTSASSYEWKAAGGTGTVTSVNATVPTGLSVSGVPFTTSGTIAIALQAGYNIPLTASTTNWNGFYDTPSTRVTDGTGLTWSGNTLNCDTASGSVQGCLTSANWTTFNNKQDAITTASSTNGSNFSLTLAAGTLTLNLPVSSASATGTLTATDWTTFNNKQNALSFPLSIANGGTATTSSPTQAGQVLMAHASGSWGTGRFNQANNITVNTSTVGQITIQDSLTPTFTTLTTGQGQNELYAMNQNVQTTDAVTFATSSLTGLIIGGDTFTELVGTGLQVSGAALQTTLGTSVDLASEITGVLSIANGGTATTTAPTVSGQLLGAHNAGWGVINLVAGSNITLTTSTLGQITITGAAGGSGNSAWTIGSGLIYNATTTDSVLIGTTTPITAKLFVQSTGTQLPLRIASSTGSTLFTVDTFGTTTINNLGAGLVRSTSGGSLFNGLASLTADVSGILPVANGGSGASTLTGMILGNGTAAFTGVTGTAGFNANWSSANSMGTGKLIDNGTVIGMNATSSTIEFNIQGTAGANDILNIASSTGISILRVTNNQRVGIGSTTPYATLVVQGTSTSPTLDVLRVATSTNTALLTVTSAGRVGIGTSTPTALLHLEDISTTTAPSVVYIGGTSTPSTTKLGCLALYDDSAKLYVYIKYVNGAFSTSTTASTCQ